MKRPPMNGWKRIRDAMYAPVTRRICGNHAEGDMDMTKKELIERLAHIADDAEVFLEIDPEGDLFGIEAVRVFEIDGPDAPAFLILAAVV